MWLPSLRGRAWSRVAAALQADSSKVLNLLKPANEFIHGRAKSVAAEKQLADPLVTPFK